MIYVYKPTYIRSISNSSSEINEQLEIKPISVIRLKSRTQNNNDHKQSNYIMLYKNNECSRDQINWANNQVSTKTTIYIDNYLTESERVCDYELRKERKRLNESLTSDFKEWNSWQKNL